MALLYGMRQGEALGLRWDGIDVDAGTIDLAWQVARLSWRHGCGGTCGRKRAAECPGRTFDAPAGFEHHQLEGQICLTRPKTAAGVRVVPIVPMIAAALEHRARAAAGQPNPHGLVFATPDGKPIPQKADHTAWHALLLAADLPPVPLHTARHTAATLLLEAGVDGPTAAAILGHSTVVQTRAYQHVSQAEARRALTAVQAALDGA
jgi:integrase